MVQDLGVSTWTLAAITAAFASGLVESLGQPRSAAEIAAACPGLPPERVARFLEVLAASGLVLERGLRFRLADGALPFVDEQQRRALVGGMRSTLAQAAAMVDAAARGDTERGWRHFDPVVLEAQGAMSAGFPAIFKADLVPSMADLGLRLERPGGRFLDVGVGVAALAIAMCRTWPTLAVVGIDSYEVVLELARQNIERAGLSERIELRWRGVEQLTDDSSFDVAWLPIVFIPAGIVGMAIERVRAALKPGGWIILPATRETGDRRQRAVAALQNELRGGPSLAAADVEALLQGAGFGGVRTFPGPPTFTVGRQP
jgi:precorrin-6B methylase 2